MCQKTPFPSTISEMKPNFGKWNRILENETEFWKMARNTFNQSADDFFWLNIFFFFFNQAAAMGSNFKISNGKVGLVRYHWKDLFKTRILVKNLLACDDNYRIYRILQKANFQVTPSLPVLQALQNLGNG